MQSVTLIFSPYHNGVHGDAVGAGPIRLRDQGLVSTLRTLGVTVHEVDLEASYQADGDVGRSFEIYRQTAKLVTAACNDASFPIVIAGNCGASVGVLSGLSGSRKLGKEDLGCIWFDAHDDFNVPDSVLSGYFDSMAIATMADQCWKALTKTIPGYRPLNLKNLLHVGLRDVNDIERGRVIEADYPVIWGDSEEPVDFAKEITHCLDRKRPGDSTMVHVDLDCLDASIGQVNKFEPTTGGLLERDIIPIMKSLGERITPVSLTLASWDPQYDTDGEISRIALDIVSCFVESLIRTGHVATTKDDLTA